MISKLRKNCIVNELFVVYTFRNFFFYQKPKEYLSTYITTTTYFWCFDIQVDLYTNMFAEQTLLFRAKLS